MARIALVSEERARQIEMIILRMYQMGQISQVTEDRLIGLLEQVRTPVCISRRGICLTLWVFAQGRRCTIESAAKEGRNRGMCLFR